MPYKIALIGTGGRSLSYAAAYQKRDDITITALADPNASHRHTMAKRAGLTDDYAEYDDWRDMLREQTELDGA
ncbi:MAG: Gfo/Idh/MocA family oxidoreductase, partial [Gemmatimonadetes bacterium]|nr:Gfo/Idh/MocA family oxidoreductase [Gemmatimonadota bacterium]